MSEKNSNKDPDAELSAKISAGGGGVENVSESDTAVNIWPPRLNLLYC